MKKGQIANIAGFGISLVVLVVVIVIGMVIGQNLGNSVGGTANTTAVTLIGYLGTSSGGLGSWVPTIIAIVIGALAIALIAGGFGRKGKY